MIIGKLKTNLVLKNIEKKLNDRFNEIIYEEELESVRVSKKMKLTQNEYCRLQDICRGRGIEILTKWEDKMQIYIFKFY